MRSVVCIMASPEIRLEALFLAQTHDIGRLTILGSVEAQTGTSKLPTFYSYGRVYNQLLEP